MNEILLLTEAILCAGGVYVAWRLDRERLISIIIIFLILITLTGGKVISFLGHVTNTGNVFYAAIFLATYFVIERYGAREGIRSIWIGVAGLAFFITLARITAGLDGMDSTWEYNESLNAALAPAARLSLATLAAFAASQSLNVYLYLWIKRRMPEISMWLRANTANIFSQVLDSMIFFTIAFWGVVPSEGVLDAILTGIVIKVAFIAGSAWLLYLNGIEEKTEYVSVTWR